MDISVDYYSDFFLFPFGYFNGFVSFDVVYIIYSTMHTRNVYVAVIIAMCLFVSCKNLIGKIASQIFIF